MDQNNTPPPADQAPDPLSAPPPQSPLKPDHTNALLCHLLSLAGFIGIPFGNILGPLIWWLIKKDSDPEVDLHGKEALNFQISMTVYSILAGVLIFAFVGIILLPVLLIMNLVLTILATVKASNGVFYRYPFTFRLID